MFLYFAMVTVYQNSESRLFGLKWNFTFSKHYSSQRRSILQTYYTSYCRSDYPPPSLNSNSFGCVFLLLVIINTSFCNQSNFALPHDQVYLFLEFVEHLLSF
ncbi:hypothetical protein MGC_03717 [Candida albicans P37039]|nr:hypothetical protein MGC_03717 [Candida albicans P37039]